MPGPLDINQLFDINDLSSLDKLIQTIDDLDKQYDQLVKNGEKNSEKFASALGSIIDQAVKLEKSVQGLDSSVKEQQATIAQSVQDVTKLTDAQTQLKKAQEQQTAIIVEAKTQQSKLSTARKEATKATLEDRLAQQEATKVAKLNIKVTQSQEGSIEQLRAELALTKIEWGKLSKEERENSKAGQELTTELADLNEELKQLESNVGINSRSVGDYTNSIVDAAGKIGPLSAGTQGFGSALSGITGSIPQLAVLGVAIGGIASTMDTLQELTEEVRIQLKQVSDLTGETGDNLNNLTGSIRASSEVFDKEFNEVLRAGNVLSKEFGISQEEALDIINEGFVRGADSGGDFLDQISEYSSQFKAAGIDARGLLNTIDVSVKEGIFSDKGADLIKEAGLRLREMTVSTQDALKPLGELTNQQIKSAVAAGDTFGAIKLVAGGLKDTSLSAQEVQTIIADAFGGPGEDAGLRFIDILNDIDQGYTLTSDSATEFQKAQLNLLKAEQELSKTQVLVGDQLKEVSGGYKTLGLNIQNFALKFFLILIDVFTPVKKAFSELFSSIGELIDAFDIFGEEGESTLDFFEVLKSVLQAALIGIRLFTSFMTFVVDSLRDFVKESPAVTGFFDEIGRGFRLLQELIENTPFLFAGFLAASKAAILGFKDLIVNTFTNVKDIVVGALTLDPAQLSKGLSNIKKPFSKFGTDVSDAFFDAYNKARDEGLKENEKAFEDAAEDNIKKQRVFANKLTAEQIAANKARAEAIRKANFELNKFRIEQEIKQLEELAANEDLILASRLQAISDAADKRIEIAELERDELLRNDELTAAGRTLILEQFQAKLDEIESEADKKITLTVEVNTKKAEDDLKSLLDVTLKDRINETDAALANQLTALNEAFAAQEISLVDFEQRKLDIENQFNKKRLEDQLAFLKNQLALLNLSKSDRLAIEKEIANVTLALSDKTNAGIIEGRKKVNAAVKELAQTAFDTALNIIDGLNEAEDQKRERDLEKIAEQREIELEAAGENEERKLAIEQKFAAEEQKIENEKKKALRKRAIFEKSIALTQAVVNTALGISNALGSSPPPLNFILAALTGAAGALQIAAIASTPIPQFYKGTTFSPEGWAVINEQGPEMVTSPSGQKSIIYSDGPTYAYLKRGSRVDTAQETERMLNSNNVETMNQAFNDESDKIKFVVEQTDLKVELRQGFDMLAHTYKSQKRPFINIDKNDIHFMSQDGLRFIEYINKKYPN